MTVETSIYWHKRTWRIAAPVIITNISVPMLGAVDTAVVGRLPGPEYLGAVAVGALIISMMYHSCNFLRMGTTGLTAQSFGARDGDEVRTWLGRALLMALAIGAIFIALQWPIYELARLVVNPSDAVDPLTQAYFQIRIWGAPAALANYALLGWFFGIQNTKAALITQVYMNGMNIILDLWFVLGLEWGVEGVAWATIISEYTALGLGLVLAGASLVKFGGRLKFAELREAGPLRRMLSVNRDIFIRSICLQIAFVTITSIGSRLGDTTLAANAILLQIQVFIAQGLDGFATAAEALTGEAKGAKRRDRFDAAVRASTIWAGGLAVLFCGMTALLGPWVIDTLTTVESVRETARIYLIWSIFMPAISIWSFQLDGIFIGCTWSKQMRDSMFLSLAVFLITVAVLHNYFGNHGLWASFAIFMVARAITMAWLFKDLRKTVGN
ncbi:MATE family efflux transporter [Rhodospirillales bacterium]|nr:MATE family efflux transporter [Rhodospirillales bacterium]